MEYFHLGNSVFDVENTDSRFDAEICDAEYFQRTQTSSFCACMKIEKKWKENDDRKKKAKIAIKKDHEKVVISTPAALSKHYQKSRKTGDFNA